MNGPNSISEGSIEALRKSLDRRGLLDDGPVKGLYGAITVMGQRPFLMTALNDRIQLLTAPERESGVYFAPDTTRFETGIPLGISVPWRRRIAIPLNPFHAVVFGSSRGGKTTLVQNIIRFVREQNT